MNANRTFAQHPIVARWDRGAISPQSTTDYLRSTDSGASLKKKPEMAIHIRHIIRDGMVSYGKSGRLSEE